MGSIDGGIGIEGTVVIDLVASVLLSAVLGIDEIELFSKSASLLIKEEEEEDEGFESAAGISPM
jgi:hypothetical protein